VNPAKNQRLKISLTGVLALGAALAAMAVSPAAAQIGKDQQTCITAMQKAFRRLDKQVGLQAASCLKNYAKGKELSPLPSVDSIVECLADDPRGKIALASMRADADFVRRCPLPLPSFGPTDPWQLGLVGRVSPQNLVTDVWTDNLEAWIPLESVDPDGSSCQRKIWKAATKCEQAKIKEFGRCTRLGLRGSAVPGLIDSAADMRDLCLGTGTASQPDPRGKVARSCSHPTRGLKKALDKRCSNQNLTALFPTCGSATSAGTAACLDRMISCRTCMALNAVNGLDRDCELFDDGLANGSCACGDGELNAGEQCDDGNNHSNDGCTYDCRVEVG
jgi:cysteine-rich repeat protein